MTTLDDRLRRASAEVRTAPVGARPDVWRRAARRRHRRTLAMTVIVAGGLVGGAALRPGPSTPARPPAAANSPTLPTPTTNPSPPGPSTTSSETAPTRLNRPPSANPDAALTPGDTPLIIPALVNDMDPDADPMELLTVSNPAHGTAYITSNSYVVYRAAPGFVGTDSFTYTVADVPGGLTSTGTVTITVIEQPTNS